MIGVPGNDIRSEFMSSIFRRSLSIRGCQATSDPEVDAGARVGRIGRPKIVAFDVRHHFERELVVVAQEQRPLAVDGNVRRLPQDIRDRKPIFLRDRHVDARHQRKVICHVAFVAVAEIGTDVFRPLIGFGEKHLSGRICVKLGPDVLDDGVGLRKVLVVGAFAFAQVRESRPGESRRRRDRASAA